MLEETINVCKIGHHILALSELMLLPKTLTILNTSVGLRRNPLVLMYEVKPNSLLSDQYQYGSDAT